MSELDYQQRIDALESELAELKSRLSPVGPQRVRIRSEMEIFGIPIYEIAAGPDLERGELRGHARGVIAIGDIATGVIAIGGLARGVIAVGGFAIGICSLGGCSIGLLAAVGGLAVGTMAVGGGAIGLIAVGGCSIGLISVGGLVIGGMGNNSDLGQAITKILNESVQQ